MTFNAKEIFTAGMVLFAVIDIIGNIPIVISLRERAGHIHSEKASIIAGVVLAGDVSLSCAILAHEWVSSHERMGRNR